MLTYVARASNAVCYDSLVDYNKSDDDPVAYVCTQAISLLFYEVIYNDTEITNCRCTSRGPGLAYMTALALTQLLVLNEEYECGTSRIWKNAQIGQLGVPQDAFCDLIIRCLMLYSNELHAIATNEDDRVEAMCYEVLTATKGPTPDQLDLVIHDERREMVERAFRTNFSAVEARRIRLSGTAAAAAQSPTQSSTQSSSTSV